MPSIRYINQSAPFWDFVASLENQGPSHPFFTTHNRGESAPNPDSDHPWASWGWGHPTHRGWHRGPRHGPPHHGHHSPPPPPPQDGDHPAPPPLSEGEAQPGAPPADSPPRPHSPPPHHEAGPHHRRGCGPGRRGGHRGMHRGGWGGHGGPMGMGPGGSLDLSALAAFFGEHLFGEQQPGQGQGPARDAAATGDEATAEEKAQHNNDDFRPEADVFDTESAYVIHVSLPGAKKEDVGVNWDAEKSELSVAGVVYRPGDEELLKCLALDERRVGAFERKVRLGSRANPAQVDAEGISAKLEDGVLRVEVPKLDKDYVEIRKVDIE